MDGGTEVYGTLVSDIQTDVSVTGKPVYLTASGNDITVDVKKGNMTNPVVTMKPIQNLNGYDKPWFGGCGKNKFNGQVNSGHTISANGYYISNIVRSANPEFIKIEPNTKYTLSYVNSDNAQCGVHFYEEADERSYLDFLSWKSQPRTFTTLSNAHYVRFSFDKTTPITNVQLELGETVTSYEPYSNICPITSRTKTEISVNGSVITREYGQEIYGGTDEIADGVLTEEYGIYTFTGNEVWQKQQTTEKYFTTAYILRDLAELPEDNSHSVKIITSIGTFNEPYNVLQYRHYTICIATDGRIGISADLKEEQDTLKGIQICYKLKREREILTTKGYVPLDKGTNEITVSNNDIITFDYYSTLAGKISGTLSYIEDGLAPSGYLSGSGNFLVLHLDSEDWNIYTSVKVGLYPSEGSGMVEILSDEDKICVGKITSNDQVFMVESTDGTLTKTDVYSLSDLVLETE